MPDSSPPVPQPTAPIGPSVRFETRVTSGISLEVLTAFRAQPPRGNETGGILLGSRSSDPILVTDFEPVLCEHRFGPFYALSDDDLSGLDESLQWFQTPEAAGLQVLGFYRSHGRPDSSLDERDQELMRRFFAGSGSLFLLLKPGRGDNITAELFVQAEGTLQPTGHPMLFPSGEAISALQSPTGAPTEASPTAAAEAPPARAPLPPPHPRHREETQELGARNWRWVAAVVALTLAAAALGYRSVASRHAEPVPAATPNERETPRTPASNPMAEPAPSTATQVASTTPRSEDELQTVEGIRDAILQWERAILTGDPGLVAACYYASSDVQRVAIESAARNGKPAILRISELTVTPLSGNRAIASFRKHWQTAGPRISAGEVQERLIFVKTADAWKIAEEEETRVYWKQGPRA